MICAAIHHFAVVVNLSMHSEGLDEVSLLAVGVELLGALVTTWNDEVPTATLGADLLFCLQRQVIMTSGADINVVETTCQTYESAGRVRLFLTVKHNAGIAYGEAFIKSLECGVEERSGKVH